MNWSRNFSLRSLTRVSGSVATLFACALATPALAERKSISEQFEQPDADAFEGDYAVVAVGAGYGPDYDGSNDYEFGYGAAARGSVGGIGFATKGIGLQLDLVPDLPGNIGLSFGPDLRYSSQRGSGVKDEVVALLPDLKSTVELGFGAGISRKKLFTRADSLSASLGMRWDVSGHAKGWTAHPSVSYFTALGSGSGAGLSLGATWLDQKYTDYYYTITPEQSAATEGQLPTYQAKKGWKDLTASAYYGFDFDNNFKNGGFGMAFSLGYERLINSAAETPVTSLRGNRNQFTAVAGIGYIF